MQNTKKKKILIITYEMIPFADNWGGCQRIYYLAQALVSAEYKIWVASSKITNILNYYGQRIDFNQIIIEHPFRLFKNTNSTALNLSQKRKPGLIRRFRSALVYKIDKVLFNEPNKGMGIYSTFWVKKAFRTIIKHIVENGIDTVILSGPPFTLFMLARKIKRSIGSVNIIFDYRDPWNLWNNKKYFSSYIERICLKYSDLVVVSTDSLQSAMSKKYTQENFITVFNGYSAELWSKIRPGKVPSNKIIISYVGAINFKPDSFRDTTEFFKVYDDLPHKSLFEIRFIGVNNSVEVEELKSRFPEIIFMGKVPVEESLKLMTESHYLLNIHTSVDESSKYLIGAKIFDYLRSGRTIISINNPNSYEQKFLRGKNSICCLNKYEEIQKVFARLSNNREYILSGEKYSEPLNEEISIYSRENQNKRYIDIINGLK